MDSIIWYLLLASIVIVALILITGEPEWANPVFWLFALLLFMHIFASLTFFEHYGWIASLITLCWASLYGYLTTGLFNGNLIPMVIILLLEFGWAIYICMHYL